MTTVDDTGDRTNPAHPGYVGSNSAAKAPNSRSGGLLRVEGYADTLGTPSALSARLRAHAQATVAADGAEETFTASQMMLIEAAIRQTVFETWGTILTNGDSVLARAAVDAIRGVEG